MTPIAIELPIKWRAFTGRRAGWWQRHWALLRGHWVCTCPKLRHPKSPGLTRVGDVIFRTTLEKMEGGRHTAKNASSRREITQMTGPRIFVLCDQEAKPRDWFYQIVKLRNITHSQRLNGVPLNLLIWHELAERFWNSFIRAKFESSINKYNAAFWFITRENINFDSIDTHAPYRAGG